LYKHANANIQMFIQHANKFVLFYGNKAVTTFALALRMTSLGELNNNLFV